MKDIGRTTDNAKWLFERTLGWIAAADVKVGVAMALDTAMLAGLAAAFSASELAARTPGSYLFTLSAAGAITIAAFCAAMSAVPRLLGPVASNIYFTRIAEKSRAQYNVDFAKLTENEFLEDLLTQTHRNAQIAAPSSCRLPLPPPRVREQPPRGR